MLGMTVLALLLACGPADDSAQEEVASVSAPAPQEEPTVEPTAEPTPNPTPAPVPEMPVPTTIVVKPLILQRRVVW